MAIVVFRSSYNPCPWNYKLPWQQTIGKSPRFEGGIAGFEKSHDHTTHCKD